MMFDFQLRAAAWGAECISSYCEETAGVPEEFEVIGDLQNFDHTAGSRLQLSILQGLVVYGSLEISF